MESVSTKFVNIVLLIIVSSALLVFAVSFQEKNNAPTENKISNSPYFSTLNDTIGQWINNDTYSEISSDLNASMQSPSTISFGWVIWNGIISFGQLLISLPIAVFTLFGAVGSKMFGIPPAYIKLIGGAITASLVLLLVRFWRTGN